MVANIACPNVKFCPRAMNLICFHQIEKRQEVSSNKYSTPNRKKLGEMEELDQEVYITFLLTLTVFIDSILIDLNL